MNTAEENIVKLLSNLNGDEFIDSSFNYNDLNREIVHPGESADEHIYPDGALIFRTDGDFYMAALLPYELSMYDFKTVARFAFPEKYSTLRYEGDSGDPLTVRLDTLEERERMLFNAIASGQSLWPVTILRRHDPAGHLVQNTRVPYDPRIKVYFINEIDGCEYYASMWSFLIPDSFSEIRTPTPALVIGQIIDDGVMRLSSIESKHGAHTFTTAAGTDLNWKY